MKDNTISTPLPWKSISDDDLCATCVHLVYKPDTLSLCMLAANGWPGIIAESGDMDGYFVECGEYEKDESW